MNTVWFRKVTIVFPLLLSTYKLETHKENGNETHFKESWASMAYIYILSLLLWTNEMES